MWNIDITAKTKEGAVAEIQRYFSAVLDQIVAGVPVDYEPGPVRDMLCGIVMMYALPAGYGLRLRTNGALGSLFPEALPRVFLEMTPVKVFD